MPIKPASSSDNASGRLLARLLAAAALKAWATVIPPALPIHMLDAKLPLAYSGQDTASESPLRAGSAKRIWEVLNLINCLIGRDVFRAATHQGATLMLCFPSFRWTTSSWAPHKGVPDGH